jgi:hypothetical protein
MSKPPEERILVKILKEVTSVAPNGKQLVFTPEIPPGTTVDIVGHGSRRIVATLVKDGVGEKVDGNKS